MGSLRAYNGGGGGGRGRFDLLPKGREDFPEKVVEMKPKIW